MKIIFHNHTIRRLEKSLQKAIELNNFRLFKIVKSLLMISTNTNISDIAELFDVSERTIYNWRSRFMVERFTWIFGFHYKGRGRNSKLSKKQKEMLYNIGSSRINVKNRYFEPKMLDVKSSACSHAPHGNAL